jgi:hypothetical protein
MKSLCGQFKVKRSRPHKAPATQNHQIYMGQAIVESFIIRGMMIQMKKIAMHRGAL